MPRQARAAAVPLFRPGGELGLRAVPAPTPCPAQPGPPRGCHLAGGAAGTRRPCRRLRASRRTTAPGGVDNLTGGRRRPRLGLPAESSRLGMKLSVPLLALGIAPGPRDPSRFALTSRGPRFSGPCHPLLLRPQAIPRGQKCLDWGLFSRFKELIRVASGFTGLLLVWILQDVIGAVKAPGRMGTRHVSRGV